MCSTTLARLSRGPLPKDAAVEVEEEEAKEGKEAVVAGSGEGGDKPPVAVVEEDDFEWL